MTDVATSGTAVRTGTRLGAVGGVPVFAVVTDGVLYRDLVLGDTGPDVRAFSAALQRAGYLPRVDDVMRAETIAAWRAQADRSGPGDRVRLSTLVAVPPRASVAAPMVSVGDPVKAGAGLLEIGAGSNGYRCEVPDPDGQLTPTSASVQVDGHDVEVDSLVVHPRTPDAPGSVVVVPVAAAVDGSMRLGIEGSGSEGMVLSAPLSSVRTATDGQTVVTVVEDGQRRDVVVALGTSAQGWVELRDSALTEGTAVELFDPALTATDEEPSAR